MSYDTIWVRLRNCLGAAPRPHPANWWRNLTIHAAASWGYSGFRRSYRNFTILMAFAHNPVVAKIQRIAFCWRNSLALFTLEAYLRYHRTCEQGCLLSPFYLFVD